MWLNKATRGGKKGSFTLRRSCLYMTSEFQNIDDSDFKLRSLPLSFLIIVAYLPPRRLPAFVQGSKVLNLRRKLDARTLMICILLYLEF